MDRVHYPFRFSVKQLVTEEVDANAMVFRQPLMSVKECRWSHTVHTHTHRHTPHFEITAGMRSEFILSLAWYGVLACYWDPSMATVLLCIHVHCIGVEASNIQWPISETIMCAVRDVIWRTVQVENSNFL